MIWCSPTWSNSTVSEAKPVNARRDKIEAAPAQLASSWGRRRRLEVKGLVAICLEQKQIAKPLSVRFSSVTPSRPRDQHGRMTRARCSLGWWTPPLIQWQTLMSIIKLFSAAIVAGAIATPALAQAVMSEPGYCAQFYPNANCQNKGPGNPYTDPNWRRDGGAWGAVQAPNLTVGVVRKRPPRHRSQS
jgi:hypothetical protein